MARGKVLVTGGAGFIGSHIVKKLLDEDYSVKVIDDLSTGRKENISEFLNDIEFHEEDIRNFDHLKSIMRGVNFVLHQAALPSVPRSISDPITTNQVNVNGTLNILQAARELSVQRIVFASSSSVYGNTEELPKKESMNSNPLSPYAVSKLTGENYCKVFANLFDLETTVLRYFNVFGPKQDPDSQYSAVIPKFIKSFLKDESPVIFGDGTQSRDFTYVSNVAEGNFLAMTSEESCLVMNCAAHERITLNELIEQLNVLTDKNIKPVYDNPRQGDVKHSYADIALAQKHINYSPKINFKEGLKLTLDSFKEISLSINK